MISRQLFFRIFSLTPEGWKSLYERASSKNGPRPKPGPWTWEENGPPKNEPVGKTGSRGLKALLFVSRYMKVNDSFCYKKYRCVRPRFRTYNVWKVYHKFLFWKRWSWFKNNNRQFVALISMERFRIIMYFYAASFSLKRIFWN